MWESGIYVLRKDGWVVEDLKGNRVFMFSAEELVADDDEELNVESPVEFDRKEEVWRTPKS